MIKFDKEELPPPAKLVQMRFGARVPKSVVRLFCGSFWADRLIRGNILWNHFHRRESNNED